MKLVRPYIDNRKQVIFVECPNELLQNLINGMLFGHLIFVPLALAVGSLF